MVDNLFGALELMCLYSLDNYFIFRFINLEAARIITLTVKASLKAPFFHYSKLKDHPEWWLAYG